MVRRVCGANPRPGRDPSPLLVSAVDETLRRVRPSSVYVRGALDPLAGDK